MYNITNFGRQSDILLSKNLELGKTKYPINTCDGKE